MKRSYLKRTMPLKAGKRTRQWRRLWPVLKKRFQRVYGITTCEAQFEGCWYDTALTWAHPRKRRNTSAERLDRVACLCAICHQTIELQGEAVMEPFIENIISNREVSV